MASDPRLNLFNYAGTILNRNPSLLGVAHATKCPTVVQRLQNATTFAQSAASSTLGVVGEFANFAGSLVQGAGGVGTGAVGAGLINLARVSDSVRLNGLSALPATTASGSGQNYVLGQVGIDPTQLNQASGFSPSVANAALGSASQVYNAVSQGKFSVNDIPAAFSALQNGAALVSSLFTPSNTTTPKNSQFGNACGASPYALDLIALAPKYKFLFVVQFEFDPEFQSEISASIDPAFVVKASTRPNVDFEYDDVNMYNFRTKVPKKTTYQPISMRFYDDDKNNAFQLYTTYLKLVSPIANVDGESNSPDMLDKYDQVGGGMGFSSQSNGDAFDAGVNMIAKGWSQTLGQGYAGSLGPFGTNANTRNILRSITLFHVYRQGRMMNVYNFYNPKIIKMELDELDMASSEATEVTFEFSYDSVFIIPGYRIFNSNNTLNYNLPSITGDRGNALYPFGVDPSTTFDDGGNQLKDGLGMPFGQDTLFATTTFNNSNLATTTATSGGSNLTGISSIAPTSSGGSAGTNTVSNIVGGSSPPDGIALPTSSTAATGSQFQIPGVASAITDPVSGATPTSANNTQNLNNVAANQENQTTQAINQNNASVDQATTQEAVEQANTTLNNTVSNINNTSTNPVSTGS